MLNDEKDPRIKRLEDARADMIDTYGGYGVFKQDLDELVAALDKRIETIIAR